MRYCIHVDPSLVAEIASQGLLGALFLGACWVAWTKDRELKAERLARIDDAQNYTQLALELQARVINAVGKLSDILDEVKKMTGHRHRSSPLSGAHDD